MNERYILGCKINDITMKEALTYARSFLSQNQNKIIVTPNAEICLRAKDDHDLQQITRSADLSLPDSFGLKVGALILGEKIRNRVPGVDFALELCKLAEQMNVKVLLIGGKMISGNKALESLKQKFPKLACDYINGGMFDDNGVSEIHNLIEQINSSNPDIIFVNLNNPKQEKFIYRYQKEINSKIMIGVGGAVDYFSGIAKRAPEWMRKFGLEWLYRAFNSPKEDEVYKKRSLKRIFNAVVMFPLACLIWRVQNMYRYRNSGVGFIINKNNEILLVNRKMQANEPDRSEHWQLPQGGIENNESDDEGTLREMREEVGLSKLRIVAKVPRCDLYTWNKSTRLIRPYKGQIRSLYLLQQTEDEPVVVDGRELNGYKWVNKHHVVELAHPLRRKIIQIGLDKFKDYL